MSNRPEGHLFAALQADAVACAQVVRLAHEATDLHQARTLISIADGLSRQCQGHLDHLAGVEPLFEVERFEHYAQFFRQVGADETAEWLETAARANKVRQDRLVELEL